jgi:hypothetical protein
VLQISFNQTIFLKFSEIASTKTFKVQIIGICEEIFNLFQDKSTHFSLNCSISGKSQTLFLIISLRV